MYPNLALNLVNVFIVYKMKFVYKVKIGPATKCIFTKKIYAYIVAMAH